MGPWDPGPRTQIVPDPGPVKCLIGTWDPNASARTQTFGTQVLGPTVPGPKLRVPDTGTHQKVRGAKYLDINMVMNVHLSTKWTVGTSEHSFKSIDEGR